VRRGRRGKNFLGKKLLPPSPSFASLCDAIHSLYPYFKNLYKKAGYFLA
jgi:hypothetical protein